MSSPRDGSSEQTLLSHAGEAEHVEWARYLLSCGARTPVTDGEGKTAMYCTAREGNFDASKVLFEAGAPVILLMIAASIEREAV